MTHDEMLPLIGKQVIVTLAKEPELVEFTGKLWNVTNYGDCDIALADGRMLYIWPVLEMREVDK